MVPAVHSRQTARSVAPTGWVVRSFAVVLAGVGAGHTHAAQEIRVRLIDGKPCAKCTLYGPSKSIPANIVIDLGLRVPVLMHERTAKVLQLDANVPLEIRFPDLTLSGLKVRAAGLKDLEELTTLHAPELDEIPAVAYIGMPAFQGSIIELELAEGHLRLLPTMEPISAASRPADEEPRVWSGTYEERGYGYFLAARADDFPFRVLFMTKYYDTLVDANAADLAGAPDGAMDRLLLGDINLARYVAFRPEDLTGTPEPHPDLITGTNLLSHFRITIDPANRTMRLERTRAPRFPVEEREFFKARYEKNADAIEAFLKAHAASRLAGEAAQNLLALRLEEYPPRREAIVRAARFRAESAPRERRAETMLQLATELIDSQREDRLDLASEAIKIGMEYVPVALNGRTGHDLRARLGLIALRRGDTVAARRELLSAAFGLPKDPMVNLWLGELYEQTGRLTRAWSRFVQAAMAKDVPPDALRGLDRLNRNPAFRAEFTMADATELLEGRILEFHPPGRSVASSAGARTVRIIELFTCADEPSTQGPQLAIDGLSEFLAEAPAVFVQYHLAKPANDPLVNEAALARARFYQVEAAPVVWFDGENPSSKGGDEKDVEKLYAAYLAAATGGSADGGIWRIDADVAWQAEEIRGRITLAGPAAAPGYRLHAILCEKTVMLPGANGIVLHHNVARALLSPPDGFAIDDKEGVRTLSVASRAADIAASLEASIAAIEKERNVRFLMKPTFVDRGATVLVTILQEQPTRRVLAAREFPLQTRSGGGR